jgi:transposase
MNPNVLRRWIKEADGSGVAMAPRCKSLSVEVQPAFVAVPMSATGMQAPDAAPAGVRIEIQRNGATVSVMWPASHLRESGAWVRDILR